MTLRRYTIFAARHVHDDGTPVVTLRLIRPSAMGDVEHTYTLRERELLRALRDAGYVIGTGTTDALINDLPTPHPFGGQ